MINSIFDSQVYVFCNIGDDIPAGNYSLNFENISTFSYQYIDITFKQYASDNLNFEKLDKDIIDLYSEQQTIFCQNMKILII